MTTLEKDLEALRQEHTTLSARISRFAVLRLLVLLLLACLLCLGLFRGLRRVDGAALVATREEIRRLSGQLGQDTQRFSRWEDPLGFLVGDYNDGLPWSFPTKTGSAKPPALDKASKDLFLSQLSDQTQRLHEIYGRAFSVEAISAEGQLQFDLRHWSLGFPLLLFFFGLSEVYLHFLRKRRQLVEGVAARRVAMAGAEAAPLDRLLFARGAAGAAPFGRHPAQLANWLHAIALVTLLVVLPLGLQFVGLTFLLDMGYLAAVVVIAVCYLTMYGRFAARKLEAQAESVLGVAVEPTWVVRLWNTGLRWAHSIVFRGKPRAAIVTGSLMVLSSLFLGTSVGSCGSPEPGYHIVNGNRNWPSAVMTEGWIQPALKLLTRSVYVLALLLAVFSLVYILVSIRRPGVLTGKLLGWSYGIAGALSLFLLGDYSFFALSPLTSTGLPWILYWLIPLGLWGRFALSSSEEMRTSWPRVRKRIVLLYLPVILLNIFLFFMAVSEKYFGVITFYFGVHCLALGYMGLMPKRGAPQAAPAPSA